MQQWFAGNRLAESGYIFPRVLAALERLIGDGWLFDRAPLGKDGESTSSG
jgi:hypothetical protein